MSTVKIFIGNLSNDTTADDLRPLFEQYGIVNECAVLRNFGFVHMSDDAEAEDAISNLTGTLIHGSRMRVEKSKGPNRGVGRGGFGGFGAMRGGDRGRGGPPFRGAPRGGGPGGPVGRDYPPRPHPYGRDPYGRDPYDYDRPFPGERRLPDDRLPPTMYPYEREERRPPPPVDDRYPAPRDPYDRYPPPPSRYPPPPDRFSRPDPYDRYPPRSDPYGDRPPPDYYRRRPEDPLARPDMSSLHARGEPNGYPDYDRKPAAPPATGGYYDKFYKPNSLPPAPDRLAALARGGGPPGMPQKSDKQSMFQTGPIFF